MELLADRKSIVRALLMIAGSGAVCAYRHEVARDRPTRASNVETRKSLQRTQRLVLRWIVVGAEQRATVAHTGPVYKLSSG